MIPSGLRTEAPAAQRNVLTGNRLQPRVILTSNRRRLAAYWQVADELANAARSKARTLQASDLRLWSFLRLDSARTPIASRVRALHSHIHSHIHLQMNRGWSFIHLQVGRAIGANE